MLFSENRMFIPAVFSVRFPEMDGTAAGAAQTEHTTVFDPDRSSLHQFDGVGRTSLLTGMTAHALVIHPEFLCFSSLYVERIENAGSRFSLLS